MAKKNEELSQQDLERENFRRAGYDLETEVAAKRLGGAPSDVTEQIRGTASQVEPTRTAEDADEVQIRYRVESDESAAAEPSKVAERAARSQSELMEKVIGPGGAANAAGGAGITGGAGAAGSGVRFSKQAGDADTAVLVCHGMGQQVRYETISSVAEAIRQQAMAVHPQTVGMVTVLSRDKDDFLAHAQVSWTDAQNQARKVDVYEAYWAPVTEGQVSYYDTLKFLFGAGLRGLWWSIPIIKGTFKRWMFGGRKEMKIGISSFGGLLIVLFVLLVIVGLIAAGSWWVARELKEIALMKEPWIAVKEAFCRIQDWQVTGGFWYALKELWLVSRQTLAWLAVVAFGFGARYFIVEYVGDVAAYISPYKDSKFDEIRHKIQQIGLNVGKTIYGFGTATPNVPYYKRVVIVGHSLGSVLAYDTLNALLNLDNVLAEGDRRDVADRTRALITMGSPLDKTAFLFRMQAKSNKDWIREALAASVQPLIVNYPDYRKMTFDWVNIWSRADIISGDLSYYDDPALIRNVAPCVQNRVDGQAWWELIVAHTKYFGHEEFHEWLYKFVT